jgi:hypothetical protein
MYLFYLMARSLARAKIIRCFRVSFRCGWMFAPGAHAQVFRRYLWCLRCDLICVSVKDYYTDDEVPPANPNKARMYERTLLNNLENDARSLN